MAGFEVVRQSRLSATQAWERLTDWRRHGDFVPLTTVTVESPADGGLERFVARTHLGLLSFDDVMEVTHSTPPSGDHPGDRAGTARIVKRGRVVVGWAVLTVTPTETPTGPGCEVRWHEEARLRGTPALMGLAVDRVVAAGFGRLVTGLLDSE